MTRLSVVREVLVTAEYNLMKRSGLLAVLLFALAVCISCGSLRHASSEPLSQSEIAAYARDHYYMEGIKMFNDLKYDAAMDLMQHSLYYDSASAATCYNLAQYYMSIRDRELLEKNSKTAQTLLLRAVRLEPDNYWYRRLLAMNYLRQNRQAEAIEQYEEISRRFPGRTDVLITLASLYDDAGDYEKELRVLKRYGQLEDVDDELKFQRFVCYLQMGELDSAYYESGNPEQVIEILMNTTSDMVKQAESQMDRIRSRALLDLVMSFCDVVSAHEPALAEPYIKKSLGYMWVGEDDDALELLAKGLNNVRTDKDKAKIFSTMGDYYHSLGKTEQMFASYDSTLVYDHLNISVLNNYSYFMALEDRDLEKALQMSAKTLEAEPLNATFLDTYAWILFRMKKYKEALSYMEKALRYLDEDNAEIYEHYGDVLYMCGEKEKALENWHRAVQLNSSSETLDRKIREEKYLE